MAVETVTGTEDGSSNVTLGPLALESTSWEIDDGTVEVKCNEVGVGTSEELSVSSKDDGGRLGKREGDGDGEGANEVTDDAGDAEKVDEADEGRGMSSGKIDDRLDGDEIVGICVTSSKPLWDCRGVLCSDGISSTSLGQTSMVT